MTTIYYHIQLFNNHELPLQVPEIASHAGLLPGIFWQLGTLGIAAPGVTGKSLAAAEAGEHEEPW